MCISELRRNTKSIDTYVYQNYVGILSILTHVYMRTTHGYKKLCMPLLNLLRKQKTGYDTRSVFKRSSPGLNTELSF